jgi:carboxyl-terminal processing protease
MRSIPQRLRTPLAAAVTALALAACGGGGGAPAGSDSCDVVSQKAWLRNYMLDWYYWTGASPNPDPAGYASLSAYFDALRFGGSGAVPFDRWSYLQSSASYNQFFGEGRTLGYGLFVNGIELELPLRVRMVEPESQAAIAGLRRGDVILSANGRSAADMVAANDFSVFSAAQVGDTLVLQIDRGGVQSTVSLAATTYALTPVPTTAVLDLPGGGKAGYLVMKDFITQAEAPLAAAFASFRAAGATELILDLRYNGGGRVSTANFLASQVVGAARSGQLFTELRYNARHQASNNPFRLVDAPGPVFGRVVVITGARTCSASELVVNGLAPYAEVVTIGAATCGKPFGFSPVESCATTFSAVNFQSYNALNQGEYYNGIAATCTARDEFTRPLGDPAEALTAAAASYLANGSCPVAAAGERARALGIASRARLGVEPGERRGMVAD